MAKERRTVPTNGTPNINSILHTIPAAVDQVCSTTALQIETLAKSVIEDAQAVAAKLNGLALAVREQGRLATEHVTKHCARTKHTLETVTRLHENLINGIDEVEEEPATIEGTAGLPQAPQLPESSLA